MTKMSVEGKKMKMKRRWRVKKKRIPLCVWPLTVGRMVVWRATADETEGGGGVKVELDEVSGSLDIF